MPPRNDSKQKCLPNRLHKEAPHEQRRERKTGKNTNQHQGDAEIHLKKEAKIKPNMSRENDGIFSKKANASDAKSGRLRFCTEQTKDQNEKRLKQKEHNEGRDTGKKVASKQTVQKTDVEKKHKQDLHPRQTNDTCIKNHEGEEKKDSNTKKLKRKCGKKESHIEQHKFKKGNAKNNSTISVEKNGATKSDKNRGSKRVPNNMETDKETGNTENELSSEGKKSSQRVSTAKLDCSSELVPGERPEGTEKKHKMTKRGMAPIVRVEPQMETKTQKKSFQQEVEEVSVACQRQEAAISDEDCGIEPPERVFFGKKKIGGKGKKVLEKAFVCVTKRIAAARKRKVTTNAAIRSTTELSEAFESVQVVKQELLPVKNSMDGTQSNLSAKRTSETASRVDDKKLMLEEKMNSKSAHSIDKMATNKVKEHATPMKVHASKNGVQEAKRKDTKTHQTSPVRTSRVQRSHPNSSSSIKVRDTAPGIIRVSKSNAKKREPKCCPSSAILNITKDSVYASDEFSLFLSDESYAAELTEEFSTSDIEGLFVARENPIVKRDTYKPYRKQRKPGRYLDLRHHRCPAA